MDAYHVAKFFHLLALIVAAAVTAITKLAAERRMRARTAGEALEWHRVLMSAARVFPLCLLVFALTGGYMLSVLRVSMSTGFIVAGLVGIVVLFASGTFLAIKGNALKAVLERIAASGEDQPAPKLVPPPAVVLLPTVNTGVALAVVFDMVTKPASVTLALGVLVAGIVLGALAAPKPAAAAASAEFGTAASSIGPA
jgi:hypothetical protein